MDNICVEDMETIHEFLVESDENLSRLDQDLVELEKHPQDALLLGSIFRTIHTIKGACGFLAFTTLEGITHQAESILSQLRDGERELTPELVSLILETVDATRKVLASIEESGKEGPLRFEALVERLSLAAQSAISVEQPVAVGDMMPGVVMDGLVFEAIEGTSFVSAVAQAEKPIEDEITQSAEGKDDEVKRHSAAADSNIRVGVGLLDKLMDLVGELVLTRNQILQFNSEGEDPALNATSQRLNLITTELQEGVMKTRMQPIGVVWNKLPRVVRDIAVDLGKQIRLEMDGPETELDRTIIEAIKDPLMHLVRNSCDHGVESPEARVAAGKPAHGTLTLRAYHEGGQVNIEVGDDGAGIDVVRVKRKAIEKGLLSPEHADKLSEREALRLIFEPGFSTAQSITNISGRGVGMDVVKSHIEKIGGVVDISSRFGEGATVKIRIPLTLAIIPGLVINSGGERFVIPQVSLLELIRIDEDSPGKLIEYVHGTPIYRRRGRLLPIAYLNEVLGLKTADRAEAVSMIVLQAEDRQFGLVVDGINDTQEIVVKPLSKQLKGLTLYAGATIMGDGRVALILDVLGIGQCSGVFGETREAARMPENQRQQPEIEQQRLLLFRAGSFQRLAVPLSLVARLEEFPQSAIERAGGGQVVQYRGRILSLISLRSVLEPDSPCEEAADPVQVIVFHEGDVNMGLVVDQILNVTEESITVRQRLDRKGLLGSAVVGARVTDFLDLSEVIRSAKGSWPPSAHGNTNCKRVLVVDTSAFSRGMIRGTLEMAGYVVLEAENLSEAMRKLEQQQIDAIAAALDLQANGDSALLVALHGRSEWSRIPVLALVDTEHSMMALNARKAGFQDCQAKFDGPLVLASVARMILPEALIETSPAYLGEAR